MSNTLLTPTMITDEALMILHQKCNFLSNVHRGYDDRYANSGAKIGNALQIRLPNEFTSATGASLSTQGITENQVTLTLDTQRHVDFAFSSEELTLDIDSFSDRYLKPAMSVLAAHIEEDVMNNVLADVSQGIDGTGSAMTIPNALDAMRQLDDFLAPREDRTACLTPQATADLISASSTLFNERREISEQYVEGMIGRVFGFDFYSNATLPSFTSGTAASGATAYLINDANTLNGSTITVDTGSVSFAVGDVITIQGVNAVNQETKADLGFAKQFAVTAAAATGATSISIAPSIVATGAKQNISTATANNATINKAVGTTNSTLRPSVFFQKEAFAFGTADLVMPDGVDFSARRVMDGISMRVIRDYTINDDSFPCRIDVIYGSQTLRNSQAVRVFNN